MWRPLGSVHPSNVSQTSVRLTLRPCDSVGCASWRPSRGSIAPRHHQPRGKSAGSPLDAELLVCFQICSSFPGRSLSPSLSLSLFFCFSLSSFCDILHTHSAKLLPTWVLPDNFPASKRSAPSSLMVWDPEVIIIMYAQQRPDNDEQIAKFLHFNRSKEVTG